MDVGEGHALVFDWTDGLPVGRQYGQKHRVAELSRRQRSEAVQQVYDFHVHAAALGWLAVDLYDGSMLVDLPSGRVNLCDLDLYERAPARNRMGWMWGSTRFLSPEEHQLHSVIDQVTNVFALGAVAHTFLGDDVDKARGAWVGSTKHYEVAARALRTARQERWRSVEDLAEAWRAASESTEH